MGCAPLRRNHHPQKTLNWGWRVSWNKIQNLNPIPSHSDGGHVCQDGAGAGAGGSLCGAAAAAFAGGGDGGGNWRLWVEDFSVCGAGLEVH